LNGGNAFPGNYNKRHGHFFFDGHGRHGFHGQHFGHAAFHIYLANANAIKKPGVAGKKNHVGRKIDFRDSFTRLEGFPDACKGFGVADETDSLFALVLRQQFDLGDRIVALPGLQNLGFTIEGLRIVG
jgi:hypothetical protein